MNYRDKVILAPMVRIGMLPMRLLSLQYDADIVYSEEIIDYKILQCTRVENEILGTVDFIWNDGTVVFRTCELERGRVVFQLGTSDAERALKAAKIVEKDVAAIDVNMGCPKQFSIKGGMGAALLTEPDKVKQILTTLVNGLCIPVTCKIRILPELEDTLTLVRLIETCGVAALAVHGRTRDERPRHSNHEDVISAVVKHLSIPVIANGGSADMLIRDDVLRFRSRCGAASVMVARAAQWNPSVFCRSGRLPMRQVIQDYLKYAIKYDSMVANTKYCLQQLMHDCLETVDGRALLGSGSVREIVTIWGLEDYHDEIQKEREERKRELESRFYQSALNILPDGSSVYELPVKYCRREYISTKRSPKMELYEWCVRNNRPLPKYSTIQHADDRLFRCVLTFNNRTYTSTLWDKSKKYAEQAAAIVCIRLLSLDDSCPRPLPELTLTANGSGGDSSIETSEGERRVVKRVAVEIGKEETVRDTAKKCKHTNNHTTTIDTDVATNTTTTVDVTINTTAAAGIKELTTLTSETVIDNS